MKAFSPLLAVVLAFAPCVPLFAQPAQPTQPAPAAPAAQVPTAAELMQQSTAALVGGDNEGAVKLLEEFLKRYQTSPLIHSANLQIAYAYLGTKQYDKAVQFAKKADITSAPPEIQELALLLVPELYAIKASTTENEADKKKNLELAREAYVTFMTRFPKSADIESALFGKGISELQIEKYRDAITSLDTFVGTYGRSEILLDARYYAGLSRLAESGAMVSSGTANADPATVQNLLNQARDIFQNISENKVDLALANDAQMSLADVYAVKTRLSQGEEREKVIREAINAYKAVQAAEPLVASQKARLTRLQGSIAQASADPRALARLRRLIGRESQKLEDLKSRKDVILSARTKIAELYFQLGMLDEARVVFRYLLPFSTEPQPKKTALYHIALSYALQKQLEKSVEAYDTFMAEFKGNPDADNLPLVVGSLFLETDPPQSETALKYFGESLEMYPKGRFAALTAVQQATAYKQLGRLDEAASAFETYLAANSEGEGAAQARIGLANIDREQGKLQDAILKYEQIRTDFATTPAAEEASFWVGAIHLADGRFDQAISEFIAFETAFPESTLSAEVISRMGDAERSAGQLDAALETYARLQTDHADQEVTPMTYLKRAAIFQGRQAPDDVDAELIRFVEKYPENENVYIAYKTRSDQKITSGPTGLVEGAAIMDEFIEKYPQSPRVDVALLDVARLRLRESDAVGNYISLGEEERAKWLAASDLSAAGVERIINEYPESPYAAAALTMLVDLQDRRVLAGLQKNEDIETYFTGLIEANKDNKIASNKLSFTLASILFPIDPAKALEKMQASYDPALVYSPNDLDLYGEALLANSKVAEAKAIYTKIQTDFPNKGADPKAETRDIQEAQAIAFFGLGKVAEKENQPQEMARLFTQITSLYAWSGKAAEANVYVAQGLITEKKYDDAIKLLRPVFTGSTTPPEIRARAMRFTAEAFEAQGKTQDAMDTYLKVALFYPAMKKEAAVSLWKGAQLLEKSASSEADPAKKAAALQRAAKSYADLAKQYPESEFAAQAATKAAAVPK